mmetsp:Transcript_40173/g.121085  ORF Transcript_40173/g.121085 Transcript_40173/m.121085 type:complete len:279 (+) Transcript_40173:1066-1902(+)
MIVLFEDTDMRPCPAELELDGEPDFMEIFANGWDGGDDANANDIDSDTKDTEEEPIITEQGTLDSEGYVTTDLAAAPQPAGTCDMSSVDFSIQSDPTGAETAADLSRRSSQMPDIPEGASALPDSDKVGDSGSVFSRSSLRAIVMKKWHNSFWAKYGDASLIVFRSKIDFEDWLWNPYHEQRHRDYLIKARFDFRDEMTRQKSGIRGFRMTDLKLKTYGKGEPMYNFKLEKWTDLGMSIIAAFASPTVDDVESLREVISNCLDCCPHHGCRPIDDLIR